MHCEVTVTRILRISSMIWRLPGNQNPFMTEARCTGAKQRDNILMEERCPTTPVNRHLLTDQVGA